jgi:4-amino-4-deoxy-L-arabinose transferase-like glycosyltransferase
MPAAVVTAAVIAAGAFQRWWAASHAIGTLTSDAGVIGLMALQLLRHGQLTAYMWGQAYGGSLEAALTAAVFAIAGTGVSQLVATTAFSSALCALALWRTGRRIVGEPAAAIGALLFWVWPATFLWRSVKPGGTYMIGLAVALCAVGALARIRQGDDGWRCCGIAGLWCGLAFWSSPVSTELILPAALWCLPVLRQLGRRLSVIVAGAATGAAPALWFGVTHDWLNLHAPGPASGPGLIAGFPARFAQFFTVEAPIAMGVRDEGPSLAWVGGHFGEIAAIVAAAALAVTAWSVVSRRAPRCVLPIMTLALLPFIYSANSLADDVGQGRYVLFAVPMAALLAGVAIERAGCAAQRWITALPRPAGRRRGGTAARLTWLAGIALGCALGTAGLVAEPGRQLVAFPAPDVAMPMNDSALQRLLRVHGVKDAYATYWIAYRVMFETGGMVKVTAYDYDRYPPIAAAVGASRDPAYLFVATSRTVRSFEKWCHDHHIGYQAWRLASFTVVLPSAKVTPGLLPHAVLGG